MLSCVLTPLQTELILTFNWCKQTTEGTIYVIIHHYFDEDKQKEVYSEALCQIEAIKKLSKCEGWLLTLIGYMGCRNYCIICVNKRIGKV